MDTLSAILSAFWTVLAFLFDIPVIGFILKLVVFVTIAWMIYRYTPGPIRRRLVPYLSSGTRLPRNMLARKIGDADIFRQAGDAKPQIVYKEVRVTRSFWSNVKLRVRWAIVGAVTLLAAQHYETIYRWISPLWT